MKLTEIKKQLQELKMDDNGSGTEGKAGDCYLSVITFFLWYYLILKKSSAYILIKSKKNFYKDHPHKLILYIIYGYECICKDINIMIWKETYHIHTSDCF